MKEDKMGGECSTHGKMRNTDTISLAGKPEGKRSSGRSRRVWRIILKWIL
jgi:hypothetical protein